MTEKNTKGFRCLKTLTDPGNKTSDARVSNSWPCDNGYQGDLRSNLTCDGWRKQLRTAFFSNTTNHRNFLKISLQWMWKHAIYNKLMLDQQQSRNPDRNIRPPTSMKLLITVQVIELQSIKNFIPRMNVYYYKFYFTFKWAFFLFIWIFFFSGIFFFHSNFFSPSFTFWFNRLWCRCHN